MPARYDPRRPDVIADPFPSYQLLRAEDPVRYREMGVAFVVNGRDDYGVYWTLSLATSR